MRLIELNILQFGKIQNEKIRLNNGFNIIEGKNESGKSTIGGFIRFMFYGLSGKNNIEDRKKGINWRTNFGGGTLTLESEGVLYRIERMGKEDSKGSYSEKLRVIDINSGNEVFEDAVPGDIFLGLDAETYDSICNIRQLDVNGINASAVRTSIDNLLTAGDEKLNVDKAIEDLEKERTKLLYKNQKGGEIVDLDNEIAKLESEFSIAVENENNQRQISDDIDRNSKILTKLTADDEKNDKMIELSSDIEHLDKFKKLHSVEDELSVVRGKLSELKSMMPESLEISYEDISDVKGVREDIIENTKLCEDDEKSKSVISDEIAELEKIGGNENVSSILSEYGSPENVYNNVKGRIKKTSFKKNLSLVLFVLALVIGAVGGVMIAIDFNIYIGATVLALATLVLILGVLLLVQSSGENKMMTNLLVSLGNYDKTNLGELFSAMVKHKENSEKYEKAKDDLERADILLCNHKERLYADTKKAEDLIEKFRFNVQNENYVDSLNNLQENLKNYIGIRDELQNKERELSAICNSLVEELSPYDEKALKSKFDDETEKAVRATTIEALKKERELLKYKIGEVTKFISQKEKEKASLDGTFRGREEVWEIMQYKKERFENLKKKFEAIVLAEESLNEASNNFKNEIMPRIKALAGEKMSIMTNGKYSEVGYNDDMKLQIFADGETRSVENLSKGTIDLCYFSMRLSLVYNMCRKKIPPIILDETLSQIDDDRAKRFFSAIQSFCKDGGQCILFTCQKRDSSLAKSIIDTNIILL